MPRQNVLWAIVLFFGASILFGAVQRLTDDSPKGVTIALELVVLALLVGGIVVVVRLLDRRR